MKKILSFMLLLLFWGCTKEEDITQKLDLNGSFSGKVTGKLDPAYFDGTATWVVTHQGNELLADITYQNVSAQGPGFPSTNDYKITIKKYKATIVNDTTFSGGFVDVNLINIPSYKSVVNGKISKDGKRITCATDGSDPAINYVRFSFDLTKK